MSELNISNTLQEFAEEEASRPSDAGHSPYAAEEPGQNQFRQQQESSADSFDLKKLRLSQNFAEQTGVRKALLTVPVRKPDRQCFFQIHPDPVYHLEVATLELKDERETYLVNPALLAELPGEVVPKILFTAINRQGVVFLWPVRLPDPNGRRDEWSRSAMEAAQLATGPLGSRRF